MAGAYLHLQGFCRNENYTLDQIDDKFLEGFKEYLTNDARKIDGNRLKTNSAQSYFNKVRAAVKKAFTVKMLKEDPCERVRGIKAAETNRQYLTFEVVKVLHNTPCENALLKQAFLLSVLTGLRWSDVKALTWDNIIYTENNGWSLQFTKPKVQRSCLFQNSG